MNLHSIAEQENLTLILRASRIRYDEDVRNEVLLTLRLLRHHILVGLDAAVPKTRVVFGHRIFFTKGGAGVLDEPTTRTLEGMGEVENGCVFFTFAFGKEANDRRGSAGIIYCWSPETIILVGLLFFAAIERGQLLNESVLVLLRCFNCSNDIQFFLLCVLLFCSVCFV